MRILRFLSAATAVVLLGACTGQAPQPSDPAATSQPSAASPQELAALRVAYGLPDCPDTDPDAPQIDGGLPRTALPCLGSDKVVNLAGLPRTPMIINLWAQWCGPCREESPYLRAGLADLDGVSFIGINYDDPLPDWALEFAHLVGWNYPHVADRDKQLQVPLKVPGLPTTLFVAADGAIAGVHAGVLESEAQLKELATRYLGVS